MNCEKNQKEITIGVDTGKFQLDVHIRPLDIYFTVDNNDKGIKEALKKIKPHKPTRIVIEATRRLEHAFIMACSEANLPFAVAESYPSFGKAQRWSCRSHIDFWFHLWLIIRGKRQDLTPDVYIISLILTQ